MNKNRIEAITGLRGFAALLVVYAHFAEKGWQSPDPHFPGEVGVMIFFSLSGFLIAYLYLDNDFSKEKVWSYITARVARIAPAYLFVVLTSFVIYNYINPEFVYAISSHNLLRHLMFSGNVSVFWSIAPEVQFYALFLLIWMMTQRLRKQADITGMLLLALLCITLISYRDVFPGTFIGAKLHYFLLGAMVGYLRKNISGDTQSHTSVAALQVLLLALMIAVELGWIAFPYTFKSDFYASLPTALLSALFVFCFSLPSPVARSLFENRFMKFCGDCSFSLYLLNMPIIYLFRVEGRDKIAILLATPACVAMILFVSWLNFKYVEKPGARFIRNHSGRLLQYLKSPRRGVDDVDAQPVRGDLERM